MKKFIVLLVTLFLLASSPTTSNDMMWRLEYSNSMELFKFISDDAGKEGIAVIYNQRTGSNNALGIVDGAVITINYGKAKLQMDCFVFKQKEKWIKFDSYIGKLSNKINKSGLFSETSIKILVFNNAKCIIIDVKKIEPENKEKDNNEDNDETEETEYPILLRAPV